MTETKYHDEIVGNLYQHSRGERGVTTAHDAYDVAQCCAFHSAGGDLGEFCVGGLLMAEQALKKQWAAEKAADQRPVNWPEHERQEERQKDAFEMVCPECRGRRRISLSEILPGDGAGTVQETIVPCPRCDGAGVVDPFDFGIRSEKVSGER